MKFHQLIYTVRTSVFYILLIVWSSAHPICTVNRMEHYCLSNHTRFTFNLPNRIISVCWHSQMRTINVRIKELLLAKIILVLMFKQSDFIKSKTFMWALLKLCIQRAASYIHMFYCIKYKTVKSTVSQTYQKPFVLLELA